MKTTTKQHPSPPSIGTLAEIQVRDRIEDYLSRLVSKVRRSEWKQEIARDVKRMSEEGYVKTVALRISMNYWLR